MPDDVGTRIGLSPYAALWWVSGGAIGFLTFVLTVPFLRDLFKFAPLHRCAAALIAPDG